MPGTMSRPPHAKDPRPGRRESRDLHVACPGEGQAPLRGLPMVRKSDRGWMVWAVSWSAVLVLAACSTKNETNGGTDMNGVQGMQPANGMAATGTGGGSAAPAPATGSGGSTAMNNTGND